MTNKLENNIKHIFTKNKDILLFVMVIICFHLIWKTARHAEDHDQIIYFWGVEATHFFNIICEAWTKVIYHSIEWIKGDTLTISFCNLHYNDSDTGIRIVWGCSGIKEIMMTVLVLMVARGDIRQKLWYIPLAIVLIWLLNYIRLVTLSLMIHHNLELFNFAHEYLFRFIMYGGIFLIWLTWIERIVYKKDNLS